MAYTSCKGTLAANIAMECDNMIRGGYTGRTVAIPYSAISAIATDAQNASIIKTITLAESAKVVVIDNTYASENNSGSTTAGSVDGGRLQYLKTYACQVPLRGADTSRNLLEPLTRDPEGFLLVIEKKDKRGIGSYEVIGYESPAKVDPASISRDESANNGAWSLNFVSTEDSAECSFYSTDAAATKTAFEAFLAAGF